jgi:hypothetical protein
VGIKRTQKFYAELKTIEKNAKNLQTKMKKVIGKKLKKVCKIGVFPLPYNTTNLPKLLK